MSALSHLNFSVENQPGLKARFEKLLERFHLDVAVKVFSSKAVADLKKIKVNLMYLWDPLLHQGREKISSGCEWLTTLTIGEVMTINIIMDRLAGEEFVAHLEGFTMGAFSYYLTPRTIPTASQAQ